MCISVKLDLFHCPARNRKSSPQRRTMLNIFGKKQSFRLSRRVTFYREGLINVNRNLHKAVYKKDG